jgi:predicted kinase
MQNLRQFLESYTVNEHNIDSAPQMIFIIGLPAAGKSTFINNTLPEYFPSIKGTRKAQPKRKMVSSRLSDSDVQLHKHQKTAAMNFANQIKGRDRESFEEIIRKTEDMYNNVSAQKDLGVKFKISTSWDWVEKHQNLSDGKFTAAFLKDFFKDDWAVNFAVRPAGKEDHKINELIKISLDPEMVDMPNFNNNDIVIPTTGSELSKLTRVTSKASDQYAISVVYLDMPTEEAVKKDEGRRKDTGRGVGRKLIESMADGIKDTWDYLSKGGFTKEGIYKLIHFKWEPDGGWGHYNFEKEYVNRQLIKDYEL